MGFNHRTVYFFIIFILAVFLGCARKLEVVKSVNIKGQVIEKVAVLPFSYEKPDMEEGADVIRKAFAANLKDSSIEVIEITRVDAILKQNNLISPEEIEALLEKKPGVFAEMFGVNAVIRGHVSRWSRIYAVVQSNIDVEASVQMIDTVTGETILDVSKGEMKNAGITRIPTGYVSAAVTPIIGMQKSYMYQLSNELSRNLAEPFVKNFRKTKNPPLILSVSALLEKTDGNIGNNGSLYLIMIGDSGKKAYFSVGNSIKAPMSESGNGVYHGFFQGDIGETSLVNFTLSEGVSETNEAVKIQVADSSYTN